LNRDCARREGRGQGIGECVYNFLHHRLIAEAEQRCRSDCIIARHEDGLDDYQFVARKGFSACQRQCDADAPARNLIQVEIGGRSLPIAGFRVTGKFGLDECQLLRIEQQAETDGVFRAERGEPDLHFVRLRASQRFAFHTDDGLSLRPSVGQPGAGLKGGYNCTCAQQCQQREWKSVETMACIFHLVLLAG